MNNLVQLFSEPTTSAWYLLLFASFAGGVLASISPCSLAMLPLIIGYVGGYSKENTWTTFLQLCCFIFGTAIVFTLIGIACALTGNVFASALGGYFTILIASLLVVMGLKLLHIFIPNTSWYNFCTCRDAMLNSNLSRDYGFRCNGQEPFACNNNAISIRIRSRYYTRNRRAFYLWSKKSSNYIKIHRGLIEVQRCTIDFSCTIFILENFRSVILKHLFLLFLMQVSQNIHKDAQRNTRAFFLQG